MPTCQVSHSQRFEFLLMKYISSLSPLKLKGQIMTFLKIYPLTEVFKLYTQSLPNVSGVVMHIRGCVLWEKGGCTLRWLKNGTLIHPCESTRTNFRPVMWQMAPTPIGRVRRFVSNQFKPYLYNMDNVMPCQTLNLSCQHIKFNKIIC